MSEAGHDLHTLFPEHGPTLHALKLDDAHFRKLAEDHHDLSSQIQRIVIAHALGAADGKPPLHVDLEPSGGPLNRWFGRGTPLRTRAAGAALSAKDHVPEPVMRLAMKALRPPRK